MFQNSVFLQYPIKESTEHFHQEEEVSLEAQRCHAYVNLVCVLSLAQLFATPWTAAHQAPRSMGFSRQEYWSGLPFPSPGDLPNPGIEPVSPALVFFTTEPLGKPYVDLGSLGPFLCSHFLWFQFSIFISTYFFHIFSKPFQNKANSKPRGRQSLKGRFSLLAPSIHPTTVTRFRTWFPPLLLLIMFLCKCVFKLLCTYVNGLLLSAR